MGFLPLCEARMGLVVARVRASASRGKRMKSCMHASCVPSWDIFPNMHPAMMHSGMYFSHMSPYMHHPGMQFMGGLPPHPSKRHAAAHGPPPHSQQLNQQVSESTACWCWKGKYVSNMRTPGNVLGGDSLLVCILELLLRPMQFTSMMGPTAPGFFSFSPTELEQKQQQLENDIVRHGGGWWTQWHVSLFWNECDASFHYERLPLVMLPTWLRRTFPVLAKRVSLILPSDILSFRFGYAWHDSLVQSQGYLFQYALYRRNDEIVACHVQYDELNKTLFGDDANALSDIKRRFIMKTPKARSPKQISFRIGSDVSNAGCWIRNSVTCPFLPLPTCAGVPNRDWMLLVLVPICRLPVPNRWPRCRLRLPTSPSI